MRRRVTVLVLCVCLSVTTLAATSFVLTLKVRYVGGYYRLFLDFNSFSIKPSVQKLWRGKANMLMSIILAATSYGADAATFHQTGPSLVLSSLTVGYKQPGIVRQRATSLSATTAVRVSVFCFVAFRILSVTFSLTRALSQSRARATTLYSAEGLHFSAFIILLCVVMSETDSTSIFSGTCAAQWGYTNFMVF